MIAANVSDYRELARRRLPHFLFEYIDGGSYAEVTLRRNIGDLESIALRQRVLRDVADLDPSTELFGRRQALPVALAPIGLAGMNARRGECQAVRAAQAAVRRGETDADRVRQILRITLESEGLARVDYAEVADAQTLAPLVALEPGRNAVALLAVRIGPVRLIDNGLLPG